MESELREGRTVKVAYSIFWAVSSSPMCLWKVTDTSDSLRGIQTSGEEQNPPEHHETGEKESGGVGLAHSSDVGSGSVNGLEDGGVSADVT